MIIGCTGNYRKEDYYTILNKIHNILKNTNVKLFVSSDMNKGLENIKTSDYNILDFPEMVDNCDIIFAIGGDGTILSTVRRLENIMKPIMGIHIGGLGFLSECTEDNLEDSIYKIINNEYTVSHRLLLELKSTSKKDIVQTHWALNDIVVEHGPSARVLKVMVEVSDDYLNTFEGDGVIISTPTGSTAYSLSAGGPIIYPLMDSITVTPICPHSLSARPIVLKPEETIKLSFPEVHEGMFLAVDGQITISIDNQTQIQIKKAQHTAELVSLPNNGYFKMLRTKMNWSGNVR